MGGGGGGGERVCTAGVPGIVDLFIVRVVL